MLDMFCFVKLLCVFVINISVRIVSLYKERSPAGVNRSGLFFCLFLLFTEIEQKNFISLL